MKFVSGYPSPMQFARSLFPGVVAHRPVDREVILLQSPRPLEILTVVSKRIFSISRNDREGRRGCTFTLSPSYYSDFKRHPILPRGFCPLNAVIIGIWKLISHFGSVDCDRLVER